MEYLMIRHLRLTLSHEKIHKKLVKDQSWEIKHSVQNPYTGDALKEDSIFSLLLIIIGKRKGY